MYVMKRSKSILMLSVIFGFNIILGCSNGHDVEIRNHNVDNADDIEVVSNKKFKITKAKDIYLLNDSVLAALTFNDDTVFKFISVSEGELYGSYIEKGLRYGGTSLSAQGIEGKYFYLKDDKEGNNLTKLKKGHFERNLNVNDCEKYRLKVDDKSIHLFLNLNDSTFLLRLTSRWSKPEIIKYNVLNDTYSEAFEQVTSFSDSYYATTKIDRSMIAFLHREKKVIQIFSGDGKYQQRINLNQAKKDGEPQYFGIYATNEFIYCRRSELNGDINQILVFNWSGDMIGAMNLDENISHFVVNSHNNIIYSLYIDRKKIVRVSFNL